MTGPHRPSGNLSKPRTEHRQKRKDSTVTNPTQPIGCQRRRQTARNDILAEAAGITAGSWYAWPSTHVGYELIGAGMLTLAGGGRGFPLDYWRAGALDARRVRAGMRSQKGE
jgi:hypothetical protein